MPSAVTTQPTDDELKAALTELRAEHPSLGIPKLHAALLAAHEGWMVSEKRTKKVLQAAGLTNAPPSEAKNGRAYPSSRVIEGLDVSKWTTKVAVKNFGKPKGKGLVATEEIKAGEAVWKEDPFILAPEWELYDLQTQARACTHCSTPLSGSSSLIVPCSSVNSPATAHLCRARFCTRLCLSRAQLTHPLLCPAQNPAIVPLLDFARKANWMALHALAQLTARVLLVREGGAIVATNGKASEDADSEWKIVRAFAELGMEERAKDPGWVGAEPDHATWKRAHKLYVQAFRSPSDPVHAKKLAKILKKPLEDDSELVKEMFEYDAFLRQLGKMSLNLEAHGGLYTLHAHLNHTCDPNIAVRHIDQRTALSRITLLPRRDIAPGEELTVSYVNPALDVRRRRQELRAWGFGECGCKRCVEEEKIMKELQEKAAQAQENGDAEKNENGDGNENENENGHHENGNGNGASTEGALDVDDLEKELKAGLGVM